MIGAEGSGTAGGSGDCDVKEATGGGAQKGMGIGGRAFRDGGTAFARSGRMASSPGKWSLIEVRTSADSVAIGGGPGETVGVGNGPWDIGRAGGGARAGDTGWARPGRMGGALPGRKLRERRACVKSAFIADAIRRYWACAAA